jgi:hypothetical protein
MSCGICGGHSSTGAGFLGVFRFPLPLIPSTSCPKIFTIYRQVWYHRPTNDRSNSGLGSVQPHRLNWKKRPHIACCVAISVITQPPHSPDLAPSDFCLLPTLKITLNETGFATAEDITLNATADLRKIPNKSSPGASKKGRIDDASFCARAKFLLWKWLGKHYRMSYHYSAVTQFRELFD